MSFPQNILAKKDTQKLVTARATNLARIVCQDDFRDSQTSYHNDAVGYAYRDTDVLFGPNSTFRLELGGDGTTPTGVGANPGTLSSTLGVIAKRRITNILPGGLSGRFQYEHWLRATCNNIGANFMPTTSIYDRDGTNMYIFRVWFDTVNGGVKISDNGTWTTVLTTGQFPISPVRALSGHPWEPEVTAYDKAGIWMYVRLVVDFSTGKYVELQINRTTVSLSAYSYFTTASAAPMAFHLSHELGFQASSAVRRYYNIADPVLTEF